MSPVKNFGPYEILSLLGSGGMGEVYRARDSRLQRDVALKIVSKEAARFATEARAVAALNHPNIVAIFDFGDQDGTPYTVSELIEGESLRQLLGKGPVPIRRLIDITMQLADGLSAAHGAGITHRDLKPENIMLTPQGRVKILDFGLARHAEPALIGNGDLTAKIQTQTGAILGTPNYMSPEQARGAVVDYRSDQFSLGLILYELATGKKAFAKDSQVETLAAIVREEPAPVELKLPAPLRWTMDRCLAKEPAARYESTRDLYQDLRNQHEHFSDLFSTSGESAAAAMPKRTWMSWAIPVACLVAGAAGALLLAPKHHGIENYRFAPIEISMESPSPAVWAPDGKAFAYSARVDGKPQVFIRYLNLSVPTRITQLANGASAYGWSADSQRIFIAGKNPQGTVPPLALFSVSITGGEPQFVMPLPTDSLVRDNAAWTSIARDGKALATLQREEDGAMSVAISSPVGAPLKPYLPAPFKAKDLSNFPTLKFSPDGSRILYFVTRNRLGEVWNIPLPAGSGVPQLILKDLPHYGGPPTFSWFPDNRHIVISLRVRQADTSHLWIMDTVTGRRTALTTGLGSENSPAVSPDGKQILFLESSGDYKLVSASLEDASIHTLISSQRPAAMPAWARKSEKFAYVTNRDGEPEIWLHEGDGSERPLVTPALFPPGTTDWWMNPLLSAGGERLAYTRLGTGDEIAIWISSLAGGRPVRLTNADDGEALAAWSPDGGRIAYLKRDGRRSLLMTCKTSGEATPVPLRSQLLPNLPDWSPTGEWISFRDDSGWSLISPDGKSTRAIGQIATPHMTFSKDGKTLYGIREEGTHQYLFSLNIATNQVKTIGDVGVDFRPVNPLRSSIHFSLAPDGKSILYSTLAQKEGLWMLEGFVAPH